MYPSCCEANFGADEIFFSAMPCGVRIAARRTVKVTLMKIDVDSAFLYRNNFYAPSGLF